MAGERTLPGLALTGFWNLGDSTWKPGMDTNLRALSALTQLSVISMTAVLPGSPTDGDIYLIDPSDGSNPNKVAVRDNGGWVYFTPIEGWRAWNKATDQMLTFNGTLWVGGGSGAVATAADYRAGTVDRTLETDSVWDAATPVALTDAATIAVDLDTFINATVTLAGNRTLGAPTNGKPGQSGIIEVVQDATGGRTLGYAAGYVAAGGLISLTLSTAANARDLLGYNVLASGAVLLSLLKDVKA